MIYSNTFTKYYEAISNEIHAAEHKFNSLVTHPSSNGFYKENIVRSIIKKHIPSVVEVSSGFILYDGSHSSQIDILLYNSDYPNLFRESDLSVITPESFMGMIEIKSNADIKNLNESLIKLGNDKLILSKINDELVRNRFIGFFAFSNSIKYLEELLISMISGCLRLKLEDLITKERARKEEKYSNFYINLSSTLKKDFSDYEKIKLKQYIKEEIINFICISDVKQEKNKSTNGHQFNEVFIKYDIKDEQWNMYEMDSNIEEVSFIIELIKSLSPDDYGAYTKNIFPVIEDDKVFTLRLEDLVDFLLCIRDINELLPDADKFKQIGVLLEKYMNLKI